MLVARIPSSDAVTIRILKSTTASLRCREKNNLTLRMYWKMSETACGMMPGLSEVPLWKRRTSNSALPWAAQFQLLRIELDDTPVWTFCRMLFGLHDRIGKIIRVKICYSSMEVTVLTVCEYNSVKSVHWGPSSVKSDANGSFAVIW